MTDTWLGIFYSDGFTQYWGGSRVYCCLREAIDINVEKGICSESCWQQSHEIL